MFLAENYLYQPVAFALPNIQVLFLGFTEKHRSKTFLFTKARSLNPNKTQILNDS